MERPTWDEYFMEMTRIIARRSTCLKAEMGAVLVKGQRLLTSGYFGPPKGMKHCEETGCIRDKMTLPDGVRVEVCRGVTAIQNAIIQGAIFGISVEGSTLYTTHTPCNISAQMLVNAGIRRIVIERGYPDGLALKALVDAGVEIDARTPDSEHNSPMIERV